MLAHLGAPLSGDVRYGGTSGQAMYLEHVILGARTFASGEWRVWLAPDGDRPAWAPALSDAVDARVRALSTALVAATRVPEQ
jgi:hypothetical protein